MTIDPLVFTLIIGVTFFAGAIGGVLLAFRAGRQADKEQFEQVYSDEPYRAPIYGSRLVE